MPIWAPGPVVLGRPLDFLVPRIDRAIKSWYQKSKPRGSANFPPSVGLKNYSTPIKKGVEMALSAAFAVWQYSEKSSGGFQTIAALKMYGLLRSGDTRMVGLTDAALRYFRDEREEEKNKLAREFAPKPKLIAVLWADWHATPPADTIARSHLKTDRGLNDQGSRSLLSIYKENLAADDRLPSR